MNKTVVGIHNNKVSQKKVRTHFTCSVLSKILYNKTQGEQNRLVNVLYLELSERNGDNNEHIG